MLFLRGARSYTRSRGSPEKERAILTKDMMQKLVQELLSNPRFAQMFMTAVQAGLETKGHIDRNIQTVLGLLNLPSRADLDKLRGEIKTLSAHMTNLNFKVDKLLAAQARERRRRKRAAEAQRVGAETD